MKIKDICISALCLVLAFSALAFTFAGMEFVSDADRQVLEAGPKLSEALDSLRTSTQAMTTAVATFNDVEAAQKVNVTRTTEEAAKTEASIRLFVDRTDKHVNDTTLPNFDAQISALGNAGVLSFTKLGGTADQLTAAARDLSTTVSDPNIKISFAQIAQAATQFAQSSKHADKILADGEIVADHYEKEIMAPVSFAKRVGMFTVDHLFDAGMLFEGK